MKIIDVAVNTGKFNIVDEHLPILATLIAEVLGVPYPRKRKYYYY